MYRVRAILAVNQHEFWNGTRISFADLQQWKDDTGFTLTFGQDDYITFGDEFEFKLFKIKFGVG